jgi:pyridoxal phosphate enzyme (YggS family)
MSTDLRQRLASVRERVVGACARAHRDPSEVEILAVTKTHPLETLLEALQEGLLDLGENRVQEALPKIAKLPQRARVHLIGRLQSNKVNKAVGAFASIESVDRRELLEKIARRAAALQVVQAVWIEVDIAQEEQKGGCPPEELGELWERGRQESSLQLVGLMGMVRLSDDEVAARARFAQLRRLAESLKRGDGQPPRLSMGMSRDFEWAVEEGSHQLRLGSVLFGPRQTR